MSEEIDEIDDNNEKNINEVLVNKQNNFTSKRKRKELINTDSENENDGKIKENENIILKTNNKEEKKENENNEFSNNTKKPNYKKNIFNTLDKTNNIDNSPNKKNLALQEKLKKIFLNRDKLKFQYTKQDIPDNLKYHSDDSDSSEVSGLRKSKIYKKNNDLFKENNDNNKEYEIKTTNKKSNINPINDKSNNNDLDKNENKTNENEKNIGNKYKKEENTKSLGKNLKNQFSYNNINYINKEKIKTNNIDKKRFLSKRGNHMKDNDEKKEDLDNIKNNEINTKKEENNNIPLKISDKKDKKDNNELGEGNKDKEDKKQNNKNSNNKANNFNKKQNLLKLLIEKKNSNNIDNNIKNNNKDENKNEENIEENDEDKEDTLKMKFDVEKESRRRRIINQIKSESESDNALSNKKNTKLENEEKSEKSYKKEEKVENKDENENECKEDETDEKNNNDKGTYIFSTHRNKLTINIKPKQNLQQQISSSKKDKSEEEGQNEKGNKNEIKNEKEEKSIEKEEENNQKNKKANALFNILEKLKQKKSSESKIKNLPKNEAEENYNDNNANKEEINESEIEKEAEKIRKKEKKLEERKKLKEKNNIINNEEKNENEKNSNNNYLYKNRGKLSNKDIRKNETTKNEEIKRRKKLEEDLKAEINKQESFNDANDVKEDEVSTINNTSKSNLNNNSYANTPLTQNETEEIKNRKEFSYKPIPIRNTSNSGNRYKNIAEENTAPKEIVLNDIHSNNLDRSFDAVNAYMKRKIPKSKNSMNIYKPKKVNNFIRNRAKERNLNELIENESKSFNPNNNIIYNNNNDFNAPNIYRNKNTLGNNNYVKNNHSFCEYPIDNSNPNTIMERNNVNMEIDLGGGLNTSFDAYMNANINSFKNKMSGNIFNTKKPSFYGNENKYNTSGYHKKNSIPTGNNNYNKNTNIGKNYYKNDNANKSYGYINSGFNNNNIFDNNTFNNINNNNYNRNMGNNKNKNYFYGMNSQNQEFVAYNNNSHNSLLNYNNHIPLKTYSNQNIPNISNETYENNIFQNNYSNPKRYPSSKINNTINNINNPTNINNNNYIYNNININNTPYEPYQPPSDKNTSINIEDLLVLEEKFNEIIIGLKRNRAMHNECFEFWNFYFNCSLYGRLEKLFKNKNDSSNVQISINHILISVMICYDYSYEIHILNGEFSILEDILNLNHKNLMIIYEHILSKISIESKSNIWVLKLNNLINNFNQINNNNSYYTIKGRQITSVEKIMYNTSIIIQNIRVLLKNYKTERIEYLTTIFKKINEKTYEEINIFFRDNILRVDNLSGSVLASVFLKENEYFQTEPAPYIKTKNRKPYSLILDLDETLIHFKINNEDENEGVFQIRPGVVPFLEQVGKYYELIVFTAATQDYGDLLIDAIEENNLYFEHRFYRQHTVIIGNDFVKDLNRIGRPIDKVIIVDNMPQNFRLQKENGINIKAFWGEDADDNALEELGIILTNIAKEGGDVRIGLEKYKDEIVRKVTSNISKSNY